MIQTTTTAHTNIALIKYWGKKDPVLHLPYTDSLSLTLDGYYTTTTTSFLAGDTDQVRVNNQVAGPQFFKRTQHFLNLVRTLNNSQQAIAVETINHVPTAAGLASSASGFAALSGSLNKLFQMNLSRKELSCLARRGSGSATRSIYGGFVQWHQGKDNSSSFAEAIDENPSLPIRLISVVISKQAKKISSTEGMKHAVSTSPFYAQWPQVVHCDMQTMLQALKTQDLEAVGRIAENNCLAMHALNWTSRPAFSYFTKETLQIINLVHKLRSRGYCAYYTIDAGANVKVITSLQDVAAVQQQIQLNFPQAQLTPLKPGPGIQ